MNIKYVKLFILFFIFFLCKKNLNAIEPVNYEKYADQIVDEFSDVIKKKYGCIVEGSGGTMPYDIQRIYIQIVCHHKPSIDQARELEVRATEILVDLINNHEQIRPYLREYPLKSNRVALSLSFRYENSDNKDGDGIIHVYHTRNIIFYDTYESMNVQHVSIKEEPYEQARQIVLNAPASLISDWKPSENNS